MRYLGMTTSMIVTDSLCFTAFVSKTKPPLMQVVVYSILKFLKIILKWCYVKEIIWSGGCFYISDRKDK